MINIRIFKERRIEKAPSHAYLPIFMKGISKTRTMLSLQKCSVHFGRRHTYFLIKYVAENGSGRGVSDFRLNQLALRRCSKLE